MFKFLANIMSEANLDEVTVILQKDGGSFNLVLMPKKGAGTPEDQKLQQAFSQPLVMTGSPVLLDNHFEAHLNEYSEGYLAKAFASNLSELKDEVSKDQSNASEAKKEQVNTESDATDLSAMAQDNDSEMLM